MRCWELKGQWDASPLQINFPFLPLSPPRLILCHMSLLPIYTVCGSTMNCFFSFNTKNKARWQGLGFQSEPLSQEPSLVTISSHIFNKLHSVVFLFFPLGWASLSPARRGWVRPRCVMGTVCWCYYRGYGR